MILMFLYGAKRDSPHPLVEFRTPDFRKKRNLYEDETSSAIFLERRFASLLKSL